MGFQIGTEERARPVAEAHGPVRLRADRTWTRNEVRQHARKPDGWGIVARWRYSDNPELGEFGGEFLWYDPATGSLALSGQG